MIQGTTIFLVVLSIAAIAPFVSAGATRLAPVAIVPIVVVELVLGAIVGPHGFGLASVNRTLEFFATLGLGFLFFFAGFEIDFERLRGAPLRWAASAGSSRWGSPMGWPDYCPSPGWSSRVCSPARRSPPPRSGPCCR